MTDDARVDEVRAAWRNQPANSLRVPTQLMRARAGQIDALLRRATFAIIVGGTAAVPILGWGLYSFPNPLQRIGIVLTIVGVAFLIYQVRAHVVSTREATEAMNTTPSVIAYRAALERRRDFYQGVWAWSRLLIFFPGPLIFLYGAAKADPGDKEAVATGALFVALAVGSIVSNRVQARRFQIEIDEVDRLQSGES